MHRITTAERRRRLALRHHLAPSARTADVVEAAGSLVGLHSSDPATVYMSAWARLADPSPEAVERPLYDDLALVRALGMRRTLFVVPVDLAPIVHAACSQPLADRERARLVSMIEGAGIAADAGRWLDRVVDATHRALLERGEATAAELTRVVPELGRRIPYGAGKTWQGEVGVSTRVLFLLAAAGLIARSRPRGSWISGQYRWAPIERWLPGGMPTIPTAEARAQLAGRWLRSFGPAPATDLKWWTGWTVAQTRAALADVGAVEVSLDDGVGHVLPDDLAPVPMTEPWAALLPSLDPTVMGWSRREWYLGPHRPLLFDRNGNAGPTVWWDGRVVGGWGLRPGGTVAVRLLEEVGREAEEAIGERSAQLEKLLDGTRPTPRFRTPLETELASTGD